MQRGPSVIFKLTRLSRMACRNNLKAASLLFEGNSLFQQNNSLFAFQNSLFR